MLDAPVGPQSNEHIATAIEGTRYLTFRLAEEWYGVEIVKVVDITCHSAIVRMQTMPPILRGFVNLGGTMLPAVDLRQRSAGASTGDGFNVVIAVRSDDRVIGIVVDGIADVLTITAVNTTAPPHLASSVDPRYISGIGQAGDTIIRLLNVDPVIRTVDELARLRP